VIFGGHGNAITGPGYIDSPDAIFGGENSELEGDNEEVFGTGPMQLDGHNQYSYGCFGTGAFNSEEYYWCYNE
jgi:hypothetical protein